MESNVQGIGIESYPLRRYLLDKARGRTRDYRPHIATITVNVAQLATDTTGTVDIDTDAPFLMLYTVAQYRDNLNLAIVGALNGTALLRIGGPGARQLTRSPCALAHLYPQRGCVNPLPYAYPIEAGSQLHATIRINANPFGTGQIPPYECRLLHIGLKLYGYGAR